MAELPRHQLAAADESSWEGLDDDQVILQRTCPDCRRGLLSAPARFCGRCRGDGLLMRTVPAIAPA